MRMLTRSMLLVCVVVLGACARFDRSDRIEDLRVLAMRTEPAEILYSPLFLLPPEQRPPGLVAPTTDVHVEVYAYDPRGGLVKTQLQLCPDGIGDRACRLYDPAADLSSTPVETRAELAAVLHTTTGEAVLDESRGPVGRVPGLSYSFRFTPTVMDFLLRGLRGDDADPPIFPILPRFVAVLDNDAQTGVRSERAFKRLPLSLDVGSPQIPLPVKQGLASQLGFTLCDDVIAPEDFHEGPAPCLMPRGANENPALLGFVLEEGELAEGMVFGDRPDIGRESLLRVAPGTVLAVSPMFRPGAVENYQVFSFDLNESKLVLLNRVEDFACSWYSTHGNVSAGLTSLQQQGRLGIRWALPATVEPDQQDALVLVVLDQRGGTSVAQITVTYR